MSGHRYEVAVHWVDAAGTVDYRSYTRNHSIVAAGKPALEASSDPAFRGDAARYNPEELLVAALASCHMLWYLHLCAQNGIVLTEYHDTPVGEMELDADGSGQFTRVTLHPSIQIATGDRAVAASLHARAHELCLLRDR